jgi:glutamine amidotransferase
MKIGVIDYGMSNKASIINSLNFLGFRPEIVKKYLKNKEYDILILPGVGAFNIAMKNLKKRGLDELIYKHNESQKKIIGICLGMQLFFDVGYENEKTFGLGLIKGKVTKFKTTSYPLPHVGWNYCKCIDEKYSADYYFVHSFKCEPQNKNDIYMTTKYDTLFCSSIKSRNIFGFQFHPEKSQKKGLSLLYNTLKLND